jgi:methenyltetrahydromethanopterin cyclohydrolase
VSFYEAHEWEWRAERFLGMLIGPRGNADANSRVTYWRPQGGFGTFPEVSGLTSRLPGLAHMNIHLSAIDYLHQKVLPSFSAMNGVSLDLEHGMKMLDFGCKAQGGLRAGIALAELCMAGLAEVRIAEGGTTGRLVQVVTDRPLEACMASQYAGWPISVDDYFAMGSGPVRAARGKEKMLEELNLVTPADQTVAVLETKTLPDAEVAAQIAEKAGLAPENLVLAGARTASIAGSVQIVARSVETCMHKLHELGVDLRIVCSGVGAAPLPPIAVKDMQAMGWTNDAILYGGQVSLWCRGEDDELASIIEKVPSQASKDFGRPFMEIFEQYERDFYKIDPHLFSPAEVTLFNLNSGRVFRAGAVRPDLLRSSFHWP